MESDKNVVLECCNGGCLYRGYHNAEVLARELADAARAGHAEHRLTA